MKITTLLLCCCFSLKVFASPYYVGNGGDGYLTPSGQVELTDLLIGGKDLNENPWFGPDRFDASVNPPLSNVVFPEDLLSRKLADINKIDRGLGFILADVIGSYRWTFIDEELGTTCDASSAFIDEKASGLKHVQIANRYLDQIRINRQLWEKMSAEHRVALVIHEATYGLMKPAAEGDLCTKSINNVRALVATFFTKEAVSLPKLARASLNISEDVDQQIRFNDGLKLPLGKTAFWVQRFGDGTDISYRADQSDYQKKTSSVEAATDNACREMARKEIGESQIRFWMLRRPYALKLANGAVRVEGVRPYLLAQPTPWLGVERCEVDLPRIMTTWFSDFISPE